MNDDIEPNISLIRSFVKNSMYAIYMPEEYIISAGITLCYLFS